jgi:DNA-binding NarL/FixJ family response regulator
MAKASIILADDHALFRRTLRQIIEKDPGLNVVGEAENGVELIRILKKTLPEIVIMDISMPRLSGLKAAGIIKQLFPGIKILILSMHTEKEYLSRASEIGVEGYLLKKDIKDLNVMIKSILASEKYFLSHQQD